MQPHKRRKTLLACNQCRGRKTRCSGDRPLCRSCQERHLQCRYEQASIRTSSSAYDTERRLRLVERLDSGTDRWAGLNPSTQLCAQDTGQDTSYQLPITRAEAIDEFPEGGISRQATHADSSADSFLSQVGSTAHGLERPVQPETMLSPYSGNADRSSRLCDALAVNSFVPEPDVDIDLMESFWNNIHPIFPLLHRPTILQAYEHFCEPHRAETRKNSEESNTFQAILYIVFALGIQYDKQLAFEHRVTRADAFYKMSLGLVSSNAIDNPTQLHVQLFLLTGIYLHSTAYANRCWDMIGTGIRIAIGLGLFRESASFHGKESQLKREMRRRIWFCCVILDKMSAATFGRPTTLPRSWKTMPPKAIDDEFLQCAGEGSQPLGLPSYVEGFVYSLGLFEVLDDVLAVSHDPQEEDEEERADGHKHRDRKSMSRLVDTLSLNSRLEDLVNSMPDRLRLSWTHVAVLAHSRDAFHVQAQVLHCRIHYVRLLILRPWLLEGNGSDLIMSLGASTLREIRSLCILTAQQTIDVLHKAETCRANQSSWHAVYFLYTAASVLLAAAFLPKASGGIDLSCEPYLSSWHKALQTLRNNEVQLQACSQAVKLLESCREKLRSEVINRVSEESRGQDAGGEHMPSTETDIDWAFDFESLDFLRPSYC